MVAGVDGPGQRRASFAVDPDAPIAGSAFAVGCTIRNIVEQAAYFFVDRLARSRCAARDDSGDKCSKYSSATSSVVSTHGRHRASWYLSRRRTPILPAPPAITHANAVAIGDGKARRTGASAPAGSARVHASAHARRPRFLVAPSRIDDDIAIVIATRRVVERSIACLRKDGTTSRCHVALVTRRRPEVGSPSAC